MAQARWAFRCAMRGPSHELCGLTARVNTARSVFVRRKSSWRVPLAGCRRRFEPHAGSRKGGCAAFRAAMPARGSRPCCVMSSWSPSGWLPGFVTAPAGAARSGYARPRLNTPCIAISTTSFGFCGKDAELHRIIADIREEEHSHLHHAEARIADVKTDRHVLRTFIAVATEGVFWLSTWGDSICMARDLRA